MKKIILLSSIIIGLAIYAVAQIVPPSIAAYISDGAGGWTAATSTTSSGGISSPPPAQALYCFNTSTSKWVPADSNCFGGGGSSGFPITLGSTSIAASSTTTAVAGLTINGTTIPTSATLTQTIGSGTIALGTGAISSATCATAATVTISGTASTDAIIWNPNADISGVTGYVPLTTGGLTIAVFPTTNTVSAKVCNWTSSPITPGAVTLNVRVVR